MQMSSSDSVSASACAPAPLPWYRTKWVATAIRFIILGVLCGWFYGWATSIFYPKQGPAGFSHGMVHGAVMPMAMPSLIMGKDVVIYAPNNTGITYKLGYTVGINVWESFSSGSVSVGSRFRKCKMEVSEGTTKTRRAQREKEAGVTTDDSDVPGFFKCRMHSPSRRSILCEDATEERAGDSVLRIEF